ncbi:MAG: ArsR family transcriptional regulator [Phycisphaera sp.]|nr:MAG: ArsR family transcriptional regulator [Phycisphaera sp.]
MAKKSRRKSGANTSDPHGVLASPVRREIWSYLRSQGPHTVSEIAKGVGRSQTSLYAHIVMMERTGVIEAAGSKRSGKRHAVIYKAGVTESDIAYDPKNKKSVRASARYAAAVFRRANREVTDHLASGEAKAKGRSRDTYVLGGRTRLSKKQLADINSHIDAIDKIVAEGDKTGKGDLYAINVATCPVEDGFLYD